MHKDKLDRGFNGEITSLRSKAQTPAFGTKEYLNPVNTNLV
jgi:hypothetical protein